MATISSMANNTYMMYKMAQNQGLNVASGTQASTAGSSSALSSLGQHELGELCFIALQFFVVRE